MAAQSQEESIELQGELLGHKGWITCIATALDDPDTILTGSRDKSIVVWKLSRKQVAGGKQYGMDVVNVRVEGKMVRRLVGHSHFVSDVDVSGDSQYALSASWDGSCRLWNLATGETQKQFKVHTKDDGLSKDEAHSKSEGHTKDVLSVAFSADNRHIVSGSRDHSLVLWNTIGVPKKTIKDAHRDWVTCARISPSADEPVIVSCGRDRAVKVWSLEDAKLKFNLVGHTQYVNSVTVSPDGSLCACGGKDGMALLWDLNEGKPLSTLKAGGEIHALCFSPNRYWLCGAVGDTIKIWDLETKEVVGILEYGRESQEEKKKKRKEPLPVICTCLAWSHDGKTLFAGYTDHKVRVWSLISNKE